MLIRNAPLMIAVLATTACAGAPAAAPPQQAPIPSATPRSSVPVPPRGEVKTRMVAIAATKHEMQSVDRPPRTIDVAPFAIDEHEVALEDYRRCVDDKACSPPARDSLDCNPLSPLSAKQPVNCVDAVQAQEFCAWAGKRLPTEDEWDAAARSEGGAHRWSGRSCLASGRYTTCPVEGERGERVDRSELGIFDMSGNVAEWTSTPFVDPERSIKRPMLTTKGGHFDGHSDAVPSYREAHVPRARLATIGFRCAQGGEGRALDPVMTAEPPPRDVTEAELTSRYTKLWRKLLARTNRVDVGAVERAVTVRSTAFDRWQKGTSFSVRYTMTIDWATVDVQDSFLVRIAATHDEPSFPAERWLEDADVERLTADPSGETTLARLPFGKHLAFPTQRAAHDALAGSTRATFPADGIRVEVARPQWPDPHLYISAAGTVDRSKNQCLDVTLDLVTGTATRVPRRCAVR